jgi:hypothetical protein
MPLAGASTARYVRAQMSGGNRKRPMQRTKGSAPRTAVWTLVLIDQGPLRAKASEDCRREMRRLERAREEWRRFEQEDQPAFSRWMAVTFGALMSELREINAAIHEREMLVEEVEQEMFLRGWSSHERAYRAIHERKELAAAFSARAAREIPGNASGGESRSSEESPNDNNLDPFEQEALFREFAREFLGIDPDRLSDSAYDRMFKEFRRKTGMDGSAFEEQARTPERLPAPAREEKPSRLKELYRILVRRLHPDTRADSDAAVSAIWHDVQEAYAVGNVERMEMLLAMTDLQADAPIEHTTLSQMLAILKETRRAAQAVLRSLSRAKKELAWNFATNVNRAALEKRLRAQMERDIAGRRTQLQELDVFIASWSKSKRRRGKHTLPENLEFCF